jgi:RNA polymerase sigma-70 factor, ECF subfamily
LQAKVESVTSMLQDHRETVSAHRETISAMKAEIPRLRRFARYMSRDADYADDLVQECLTRAIANIASWQPGTNLRAWLFVILKNVFRNDKRRAQHDVAYRNRLEKDMPLYTGADQHHHLVLTEVQDAFERLTEDHREVLMLIAVEGLRYEEAASVLNISVGTVKSRLSRARTALRALVDVHDPDPGAETV